LVSCIENLLWLRALHSVKLVGNSAEPIISINGLSRA
jgi:hypothetical protein